MADDWHFSGQERRRRTRPDPWFLAAWVFLVIVVACGFLIQARTIDQLRETERIQHVLICHEYPPDVLARNGVICP